MGRDAHNICTIPQSILFVMCYMYSTRRAIYIAELRHTILQIASNICERRGIFFGEILRTGGVPGAQRAALICLRSVALEVSPVVLWNFLALAGLHLSFTLRSAAFDPRPCVGALLASGALPVTAWA